jgi:type IV pilus assembly protein PilA
MLAERRNNPNTRWQEKKPMKNNSRPIIRSLAAVAMALVGGSVQAATLVADSPVSQNYVIRSQVMEGVRFAHTAMASVANAYAFSGYAGVASVKASGSGNYVSRVSASYGRIDITYGGLANAAIANKTLSLTPYATLDERVVWRCGNRPAPPNLQTLGGVSYIPSTVDDRYSSAACAALDGLPDLAAYRRDIIRERVAQGLALAESAKVEISANVSSFTELSVVATTFNAQNGGLGLSSQYVSSVLISPGDGTITVTFNPTILGIQAGEDTLILTPFVFVNGIPTHLDAALAAGATGAVDWSCASVTSAIAVSRGMMPSTMGTLLARYAPRDCR